MIGGLAARHARWGERRPAGRSRAAILAPGATSYCTEAAGESAGDIIRSRHEVGMQAWAGSRICRGCMGGRQAERSERVGDGAGVQAQGAQLLDWPKQAAATELDSTAGSSTARNAMQAQECNIATSVHAAHHSIARASPHAPAAAHAPHAAVDSVYAHGVEMPHTWGAPAPQCAHHPNSRVCGSFGCGRRQAPRTHAPSGTGVAGSGCGLLTGLSGERGR